ncbi:5-dehydro-4-deoxy-D-glucuronate isomerase [Mucilaginibacter sp.]|uniref:5-dehydro-4-deoxy-D-glucuronate isomerase n=1 Tax=Mucilaginibacter sp. TaxID=1882438 RepID=UPI003B00EB9A
MEIRFQNSPKETSEMDTEELRSNFLAQNLMVDDEVKLVYSHYDRMIIGGAKPVTKTIKLENHPELRAEYFLERREIGIINVGGAGQVEADGVTFDLEKLTCVYLGKGTKNVVFKSNDPADPALFYLLSASVHQTYPSKKMTKDEASPGTMGAQETANHRTIYRYIHLDGLKSCQLVMGLTILSPGSVWNTMPAHTHTRRTEAYFYFDMPEEHRVIHFMGEPQETRHLVVANNQAIISPPWSIHSGCGTACYGFIWGMAGENLVYSDMDPVAIGDLR